MENESNNNEQINFIKKIVQSYNEKWLKNVYNQKIISALPSFIASTLESIIKNYQINKLNPSSDILKLNFINDCLNDEFNTGCWRDVDVNKRIAFTISSCFKVLITLQNYEQLLNETYIKDILKSIDMGLLLGAPIFDENDENILSNMGVDVMEYFNKYISKSSSIKFIDTEIKTTVEQKLFNIPENCKEISTIEKPELNYFYEKYFKPCIPVKLLGCIDHWPAKTKWENLDYFIKIAGERTIPIEIGAHYAHENWTQKLLTMKEFITNYVIKENDQEIQRGYLAQHTLFDQLPQLRNDIIIPDYCALSDDNESNVEPEINAWFGPKGTLSPLHYDPKHNLLTQVIGSKQIILFSPKDSAYLYPYEDVLLFNTSQVDPVSPNLINYPEFTKAIKWCCLLRPGEMLYIPPKWWHYVVSLEKSFSVSFWWS